MMPPRKPRSRISTKKQLPNFLSQNTTKLRKIAELYDSVKAMMLFGEEVSPNRMTIPQVLKEIRDAFDHMMRIIAVETGLKEKGDKKYLEINLDKVFGHVYRCAYDVLDWVSIVLRFRIDDELRGYSGNTISAAIPDYYTKIRPRLYSTIPEEVAEIRGKKDIGTPDTKAISKYADCVLELKQYWEIVVAAKSSLIDYSKREKGKKYLEYLIVFAIGIVTAAVAGLLIWYFLLR